MMRGLALSALAFMIGASGALAQIAPAGFDLRHPEVLRGFAAGMAGRTAVIAGRVKADVDAEGSYWYNVAMKLGREPRLRHRIARALNARNGFLDRKINGILLKKEWETTDIPRMDQVAANLIRGGEPTEKGFARLKSLGVTTVVNLRMEDNDEEPVVKKAGMTPVWLPIPDTSAPEADQVAKLHELLSKPGEKVYIHCSAGIFRTGTMVGTWRLKTGMALSAVLDEMKAHAFDPEWLNADTEVQFLKDFSASLGSAHAKR